MATSEAQKRATKKWQDKNVGRVSLVFKMEERDEIKAAASAAGESVNAYILAAIRARMAGASPAPAPPRSPQSADLLDGPALEFARSAAEASGEGLPDFLARAVRETAQTDANRRKLPPRGSSVNFPPEAARDSAPESPDKGQFDFQARIDKLRQIHASRQQPEALEADAEVESESEKI